MSKRGTLAIATAAAMTTGCFMADPPPFDPRLLREAERNQPRELEPPPMRPLPTTLESPYLTTNTDAATPTTQSSTTGPSLESNTFIRMSLQEIIHRGVTNNLDVRVAGYQPAIEESRVTEAEARFDPTLFANLGYTRTDVENGFGFGSSNSRAVNSAAGIRQNLFSGGQVEVRTELNWTEPQTKDRQLVGGSTTDFHQVRRPQFWNSDLVVEVTQPLLRNFGNEINRARITVNRNNQRISLLEFRKQLEDTTSEIERTYWQLVAAERAVKINEQLLRETVETADILFKRRFQDVTRVQLSQANASIESRSATLIRAKARVLDLSDQLKRQMNDPKMPVNSPLLILPAVPPIEEPIHFDEQDQIITALENRQELGQQQLRIDTADITYKVAKNNLLPRLDAVGSISFQGLDGDFHNTIDENLDGTSMSLSAGIQLEIPIGNREANAIARRAILQRRQAVVQYSNLVDQIKLDVKTAVREVRTTWSEMVATRKAAFAQQDALLAIEQRETGGEALTPTFVQLKLDTQERLAQSMLSVVESVSNYNIAIARLELTKGTLLRYNNIMMEEDLVPNSYR